MYEQQTPQNLGCRVRRSGLRNIEWRRIEALFKAAGCEIIEGSGSRITVLYESRKAAFHRSHPGKNALRYRVSAARDFFKLIGVTP